MDVCAKLTKLSSQPFERRLVRVETKEIAVNNSRLILRLLDEAYERKTWHGANLKQSIKGLTAKEAAWRPWTGSHNIWEETLHTAYWKYAVRRRLEGGCNRSGSPIFE